MSMQHNRATNDFRREFSSQRFFVTAALTAIVVIVIIARGASAIDIRAVVLEGDTAPNSGGRTFFDFSPTWPNDAGQVAFRANLCCPGQSHHDQWGVWSEGGGTLALIARSSFAAPGIASGTFASNGFHVPLLTNNGRLAFLTTVNAPFISQHPISAIYSRAGGALDLVARSDFPAPGTPLGVTFDQFDINDLLSPGFAMNDDGMMAFRASLTGAGIDATNDQGIWRETNGVFSLVARKGEQAPGTPPGVAFKFVEPPSINNNGRILFSATLAGTGIDSSNDGGIWSADESGLHVVARRGDAPQQAPDGTVFAALSSPVQNSAGQIAFRGSVAGTALDDTNNDRIWLKSDIGLQEVAREGSQAPGSDDGVVFSNPFYQPRINELGQVAFYARLTGPGVDFGNDAGIWSYTDGALNLIARNGEQAPGFPDGVVFGGLIEGPLNDAGAMVFRASLRGPDGANVASNSFWSWRPNSPPQIILRTGDVIDVNNDPTVDDFRTISNISHPYGLTDSGQLLARIGFTDFSFGLFVVDIPSVPEPSSAIAYTITIGALLFRRQGLNRRRLLKQPS